MSDGAKQGRGPDKGWGARRADGSRIRPMKNEWATVKGNLAALAVEHKIALTKDQLEDCREELAELGIKDVGTVYTTEQGRESLKVGGSNVVVLDWDWTQNPHINARTVEKYVAANGAPADAIFVISRGRGRPKGTGKIKAAIAVEAAARVEVQAELDAENVETTSDETATSE